MRNFLFLSTLLFLSNSLKINAQCPPASQQGQYVVQRGETLFAVSRKFSVSVDDICRWNNRRRDDVLETCATLWVRQPGAGATTVRPQTQPQTQPTQPTDRYSPYPTTQPTTQPTDRYNPYPTTTPPATQPTDRYNPYGGSQPTQPTTSNPAIKVDNLGMPTEPYKRQPGGSHYVVQGETIAGIAKMYGYTEERFREINSLDNYYEAVPGALLRSTDCTCAVWENGRQVEYVTPGARVPGKSDPNEVQYTRLQESTNPNNWNQPSSTTTQPSQPTPAPSSGNSGGTSMTSEERQMVDEINLIRSNPADYAKYVQAYVDNMGRDGQFGNSKVTARELIDELKRTPRLPALQASECIYTAAKKHGLSQQKTGDTNHKGVDGSWPWDRVLRECPSMTDGNENLVGGPTDIRKAVMLLLVDDGIEGRGHRKNLLNPDWRYVACYKIGQVGKMPNCWVQDFGY